MKAPHMPPTEDPGLRDQVARAVYLGMYENDGGQWEAVETREHWFKIADRCLSLISAARKGQGEWRLIENAPKDGTWFLALQNGDTYPCEWQVREPDEGPAHEGWWDHFNESFEEPTHWCALPPPPELGE